MLGITPFKHYGVEYEIIPPPAKFKGVEHQILILMIFSREIGSTPRIRNKFVWLFLAAH